MLSMLLSQSSRNANILLIYMIRARKSRSAYLAYESIEFGIAISALPDSEPSWPTYARAPHLLATDTLDFLSFIAGKSAFSIGYATNEDHQYSHS